MRSSETWAPVSVVIRSFNEARWIGETLTALVGQNYPGEVEILLIDSGSTDGTLEIAAKFPVRIIDLPFPFNYAGALNFGDAQVQHQLIVHLSADATPAHSNYLRIISAPLREENVAASFGRDLPRPFATPSQARDLETWFSTDKSEVPATRFSNANACLRRKVVERLPFDEEMLGSEDVKWATAVLQEGYEIVYTPDATAFHTHNASLHRAYWTAYRERASLVDFAPQKWRFSPWAALRFWLGLGMLDLFYAVTHRYPVWQWFHPFVYRAAQAWGLYRGGREGLERSTNNPGHPSIGVDV